MAEDFQRIGLIGKFEDPGIKETILRLAAYLQKKRRRILLEDTTGGHLGEHRLPTAPLGVIAVESDLVIVVGGDGTMLHAARTLAERNVPLLGVNLGRLGYLTDVSPDDMLISLDRILAGDFEEEHRLLLQSTVGSEAESSPPTLALNDVVIHKWNTARMIELETYIDGRFVGTQRSDGLIVSTPTGSTAYALSGGGPLLHPTLDALVLVPVCPHTLDTRPIVVSGDSRIEIAVCEPHHEHVRVTCDGQLNLPLRKDQRITICKDSRCARLIHPRGHNHYYIMRKKLGWGEGPRGNG